mmetsp:Transcript_16820/g.30966  ORF Transcript_16820/g.30966 Transcript_16820/m.30966 type:complete len:99 (+) Transcript_16820:285-581(+)
MNDNFSDVRAATAATRTTSSAQQTLLRLLGNGDGVSSAVTPTSPAGRAIVLSTTDTVLPGGYDNIHASEISAVATEAAASSTAEAGAGACLVTSPTKK